ncbi:MAG: aminotransferase class V-fold PLP-dependent enzyme, partial [Verrucomicrobiales bacterium]
MSPKWPATSDWKKHWLLSGDSVFLNHGSFGACPKLILKAQSKLRELMETKPVQFLWRHHDERLDAARHALAEFLGADAANLAFVTNATTGVNSVVRSLEFQPDDEILTTDHNYNACRNVLEEAARRSGARVVVAAVPFPLQSDDEIVVAILKSITPRTRLAMIDHVTSNTALVFPIERIIRELEARGVDTLVDGAH